jgi:hypothetical protein
VGELYRAWTQFSKLLGRILDHAIKRKLEMTFGEDKKGERGRGRGRGKGKGKGKSKMKKCK